MANTKTREDNITTSLESGSDADVEDDEKEDESPEDEDAGDEGSKSEKGEGLAEVMSMILHRKVPQHKQIILSRGQTDREIRRKIQQREKTAKGKTDENEEESDQLASREKKRLWEEMGRVKPDPLEREMEKRLQRIATRGVVQLFNAVRKQQKLLDEKMAEVGPSERKKSRVFEGMTHGKFMDLLKGTTVKPSENTNKTDKTKPSNDSCGSSTDDSKKWSILREDFMMGDGKMKDWDKEDTSGEEPELQEQEPADLSDSD
ncbi:hypothetical protein CHS0354_015756 [Potamilus streckersoni]|uniref:RRP15-like protein n=1 Tax=Potamilus streckersoni TaxID=2493646 RepID=A0AAE0T3Y7_9BIVA|nr:hypothetical protein CHS0354_015756 [Potamilus streckersoni]